MVGLIVDTLPARLPPERGLHQSIAWIQSQEHAPGQPVPVWSDAGSLSHDVQVAPGAGELMSPFARCGPTGPVHEVHRLARTINGKTRSQTTARPLVQRRRLTAGDRL